MARISKVAEAGLRERVGRLDYGFENIGPSRLVFFAPIELVAFSFPVSGFPLELSALPFPVL
jgi:hypothetical protein